MNSELDMAPSWELLIAPALAAAGMQVDNFAAAFVEFPVEGGHRTLLNEKARPHIEIEPIRKELSGQPVRSDTIARMVAIGIVESSGWLFCVRTGDDMCAWAFDFRRDPTRAKLTAALAGDYASAAHNSIRQDLLGPATELTFAAIELALMADLLLQGHATKAHHQRISLVEGWAKHGTFPVTRAKLLRDLCRKHRPPARYAEGRLELTAEELAKAVAMADQMVKEVLGHFEASDLP
ncbi:MAG: hypothetical protein ACR2FO_02645 [Actinomycetota bacterium]